LYDFACTIEIRPKAQVGITKRKHKYFWTAVISYTLSTFLSGCVPAGWIVDEKRQNARSKTIKTSRKSKRAGFEIWQL
jgi:hypothetical protein